MRRRFIDSPEKLDVSQGTLVPVECVRCDHPRFNTGLKFLDLAGSTVEANKTAKYTTLQKPIVITLRFMFGRTGAADYLFHWRFDMTGYTGDNYDNEENAGDYINLRVSSNTQLQLFVNSAGRFIQHAAWETGRIYTVSVSVSQSKIQLSLDGTTLLDEAMGDQTFSRNKHAYLWFGTSFNSSNLPGRDVRIFGATVSGKSGTTEFVPYALAQDGWPVLLRRGTSVYASLLGRGGEVCPPYDWHDHYVQADYVRNPDFCWIDTGLDRSNPRPEFTNLLASIRVEAVLDVLDAAGMHDGVIWGYGCKYVSGTGDAGGLRGVHLLALRDEKNANDSGSGPYHPRFGRVGISSDSNYNAGTAWTLDPDGRLMVSAVYQGVNNTGAQLRVNGETVISQEHTASFLSGETYSNFTLFGIRQGSSATLLDGAKIRLYRLRMFCRMTSGGNIVETPLRDYIPAVRKSDGAVGLYDLVNHGFCQPANGVSLVTTG